MRRWIVGLIPSVGEFVAEAQPETNPNTLRLRYVSFIRLSPTEVHGKPSVQMELHPWFVEREGLGGPEYLLPVSAALFVADADPKLVVAARNAWGVREVIGGAPRGARNRG